MDILVWIRSICTNVVNLDKNLMPNRKELLARMLSNVSQYRVQWNSFVTTVLCLLCKTQSFLFKVSVFVCVCVRMHGWVREIACMCESECERES